MKKKIPEFSSEAEERKFWQENDSSGYMDWSDAESVVFSKLKPSTRKISIRLPESMIEDLKVLANKKDVPYQSLLKIFLSFNRIEFGRLLGRRETPRHLPVTDVKA